ncbi:unnamed protein product [Penicillium olsonii]|nr:unnamed protein product [Penicillium olsonii]CAG7933807.1 unnamed protein product [Penicillium olsonii]
MSDTSPRLSQKVPAHFLHSPVDQDVRLPQNIAHRGFNGQYPENTILAIEKGIEVGAHAIEIDLHISRDGVVVLSHDPNLERCYGVKQNVGDCDWEYLKTLRTLQAPHEPIPRFIDVLEYLRQPGREHIWILLDIKLTQDPDAIMKGIAEATRTVPIAAIGPDWHRRIVAGTWNGRFISAATEHLPRYSLSLICADPSYARQFLEVPRVGFNINQKVLMGPLGKGFIEEARAARRQVYVWTVDEPNLMRWSIEHEVDGVVSNEPGRFHEVCDEWEREHSDLKIVPQKTRISLKQRMEVLAIALYIKCFGWYYRRKYLSPIERVDLHANKLG